MQEGRLRIRETWGAGGEAQKWRAWAAGEGTQQWGDMGCRGRLRTGGLGVQAQARVPDPAHHGARQAGSRAGPGRRWVRAGENSLSLLGIWEEVRAATRGGRWGRA